MLSFILRAINYNKLYNLLIFTAFLPFYVNSSAITDFDNILTKAEKIKSSNPTQFSVLISKLNSSRHELSLSQKHHLKYLNGYHATFTGQLDTAIKIYGEILKSNANKNIKFKANLSLTNTYAIAKNWKEAMENLSLVISNLSEVNNKSLFNLAITVIAITYNEYGQFQSTLKYIQKVDFMELDSRTKCMLQLLTVEAKLRLKYFDENSPYIEDSIRLCEAAEEILMSNFIRFHLASLYVDNGDAKNTLDLLLSHLDEVEEINYPNLSLRTYSLLSKAFLLEDKLEKSKYYATKVIEQSNGLETTKSISQAYLSLFLIAEQNKDYAQALDYHKKYLATEKAFTDESSAKELAFQIAQHKSLEQQGQIKLLNEQNKSLTIERQLSKTKLANRVYRR